MSEPGSQNVEKTVAKHTRTFEGREQAALEMFEHIDRSCNRVRIHSAIGWMSPIDYEAKISEEAAKAA